MALVKMSELLKKAEKENYGVGAFSVANMEMVMGIIGAAEELNSPAILQVAQVRLPFSPLSLFGPLMLAAARRASVPIAVHLDHGLDRETIEEALELGFTSVMIDASHLPLAENIKKVQMVKHLAQRYQADVEAEIGQLGGSEGDDGEQDMLYSRPKEVLKLYQETHVDAIALSIGNVHGLYKKEPNLKFDILQQSKEQVPVPLVLHGGSGISELDFRRCIAGGIRKINVATATFNSVESAVRDYCRKNRENNYFKMSSAMTVGAFESAKKHILIFGSNDRLGCSDKENGGQNVLSGNGSNEGI